MPLLAFLGVSIVLTFSHGHFGPQFVLALTGILVSLTVIELVRPKSALNGTSPKLAWIAAIIVGTFLLGSNSQLIYAQQVPETKALVNSINAALTVASLMPLALLFDKPWRSRVLIVLAVGVIGLLLVTRRHVLWSSPQPFIDVWTFSVQAVRYFLDGKNPYVESYVDIYGGRYDYVPRYPYLPMWLLWSSAFAWIGKGAFDVRASLVAADVVIVGALIGLGRAYWKEWERPLLAAAVWLACPISLFILEQSWIDALLSAALGVSFFFLAKRRWLAAGIAVGAACATKQYAFIAGGLLLIWVWRTGGKQAALRFFGAAAGFALVVVLPFLLSDPGSFAKATLSSWADAKPRPDSLSLVAFIAHTLDFATPDGMQEHYSKLGWIGPAAVLALTAALWRRKNPTLRSAIIFVGLAYGWMFEFARQAFCNYYHFVAFFFLVAALLPAVKDAPAPVLAAEK
ncbi:MAG: glycosyltransferase 87 family protein [Myxococcales bacterium]|nr:glycosyltransferase 87 family protein [Myxococcales bacterium]